MDRFVFFLLLAVSCVYALDPDAKKRPKDLITGYNYPYQEITVTTEDGYQLTVHRINDSRNAAGKEFPPAPKIPVLLMHDILSSSADFVNMGERSLAFVLADSSCDVWIANARGNAFSNTGSNSAGYWNFSWHEIGYFDIPAIIDAMIEETGSESVYYIGHGQGTTAFHVMASERPEDTAEKVRLAIALAPVVFNRHVPNPILRIANSVNISNSLEDSITETYTEVFGFNSFISDHIIAPLCDDYTNFVELCSLVLHLLYGFDGSQLEKSKVSVIFSNAAAGASSKQFYHYIQHFYKDDYFKRYDYGTEKNLEVYGQEEPPSYDLSKVNVPVALFYATNDWLSSPRDVDTLAEALGDNLVLKHRVQFDDFNHIDFLFARESKRLVYDKIIELIQQYQ